jgi:hypothetical protein
MGPISFLHYTDPLPKCLSDLAYATHITRKRHQRYVTEQCLIAQNQLPAGSHIKDCDDQLYAALDNDDWSESRGGVFFPVAPILRSPVVDSDTESQGFIESNGAAVYAAVDRWWFKHGALPSQEPIFHSRYIGYNLPASLDRYAGADAVVETAYLTVTSVFLSLSHDPQIYSEWQLLTLPDQAPHFQYVETTKKHKITVHGLIPFNLTHHPDATVDEFYRRYAGPRTRCEIWLPSAENAPTKRLTDYFDKPKELKGGN